MCDIYQLGLWLYTIDTFLRYHVFVSKNQIFHIWLHRYHTNVQCVYEHCVQVIKYKIKTNFVLFCVPGSFIDFYVCT